ncbi:DpnI domain-containing protein [Seleniivibrio woodruffii]|uniref:DpnI domain-containing protein n=1 Tax=Seleniivibrio woodruffii TaxID=1078050 RepID=UPI0026EBC1EF|nr:DpnI domain-containing protein [Seleniivibrio woodruffii]
MNTFFNLKNTDKVSLSQIVRVSSETWVHENGFCANCLCGLNKFPNNKPVADFFCPECGEQFELKSKKNKFGNKITDGAYESMVSRINSSDNPNFFFMSYNLVEMTVNDLILIPKHIFEINLIERRKPLNSTAKRAGWVGCNILFNMIPEYTKVYYIKSGSVMSRNEINFKWNQLTFFKSQDLRDSKGWLLDVILCIEKLGRKEFNLNDIYSFESWLKNRHERNNNIRAKIRQQLQVLRDRQYLEFTSRGLYKVL